MDLILVLKKILFLVNLNLICKRVHGNISSQTSCAGILPADLLEESIPKYGFLPNGVSVLYDTNSHAHAYKFSRNNIDLQFPVSKVFKNCLYFPDEFSIFFVIKHEPLYDKKECILHIGQDNTTLVSIQLSRKYIVLTYNNRKVQYRNFALKDKKWHSVGFSVSASDITMTTDCVNKRRKRLKRKWPSNLPLKNATFQIASCAPARGVTLGLMQLSGHVPQRRHNIVTLTTVYQLYRTCIASDRRGRAGTTVLGRTWGTSRMTFTPSPSRSVSTASGSTSQST